MKKKLTRIIGYSILLSALPLYIWGRPIWRPLYVKVLGGKTVEEVYKEIGPGIEGRLKASWSKADLQFPPEKITLIAIKKERILEVWAGGKLIKTYAFTGYSGKLGPKMKSGDGQIPEGLYKIEYLNPNSSYHLSMKVSYPNTFDKEMAAEDNRSNLGGDIFIHGDNVTIGCIPVGDDMIEELFILAHLIGKHNIDVIISPVDFRKEGQQFSRPDITWLDKKYAKIKKELLRYSLPLKKNNLSSRE